MSLTSGKLTCNTSSYTTVLTLTTPDHCQEPLTAGTLNVKKIKTNRQTNNKTLPKKQPQSTWKIFGQNVRE